MCCKTFENLAQKVRLRSKVRINEGPFKTVIIVTFFNVFCSEADARRERAAQADGDGVLDALLPVALLPPGPHQPRRKQGDIRRVRQARRTRYDDH